ncbi:MAG: PEP-utilizing enzyme [Candidatus Kerfeldbacteria bacterium]
MTFEQAKKKAGGHTWWSEECPGKMQYCYWMHGAVEQQLYFTPGLLSVCFCTVQNGYLKEKSSEQEKLQQYFWLKEQYQDDHGYIDQEHDRWMQVRNDKVASCQEIVSHTGKWSRKQLLEQYSRLLSLAVDSVRWGFWIENVDVYTNNELPKKMAEVLPDMDSTERSTLTVTMCTPLIVSFMEEYRIDKYHVILNYRNELNEPTERAKKAVQSFHMQYRYISVNYGGSPPLTEEDIWREILEDAATHTDEELKQEIDDIEDKIDRVAAQQSALEEQHQFPMDLLDDFTIIRSIGAWMDERKESMVKTSFAIWTILGAIADTTGIPKSELEWYTVEEIKALLRDDTCIPAEQIQERNHNSVIASEFDGKEGSDITFFTGSEADELSALLNAGNTDVLEGIVASAPDAAGAVFAGTVQIVTDIEKEDFEAGNILVTSMTRPDFMPLMKKAAAIITNEGGMTCHAAIVARELGIPCIIGTKYATETLRNGDTAAMNMETGEITIQ